MRDGLWTGWTAGGGVHDRRDHPPHVSGHRAGGGEGGGDGVRLERKRPRPRPPMLANGAARDVRGVVPPSSEFDTEGSAIRRQRVGMLTPCPASPPLDPTVRPPGLPAHGSVWGADSELHRQCNSDGSALTRVEPATAHKVIPGRAVCDHPGTAASRLGSYGTAKTTPVTPLERRQAKARSPAAAFLRRQRGCSRPHA
jgi:hypothetical protein